MLTIRNLVTETHDVFIDNLTIRKGRGAWIAAKADVWEYVDHSGTTLTG